MNWIKKSTLYRYVVSSFSPMIVRKFYEEPILI